MYKIIIGIIIILLSILSIYLYKRTEPFGLNPSQDTTFDDPLFKNAKFFIKKEGEYSGYDECIDKCKGNCLAYGYTGSAWCFE